MRILHLTYQDPAHPELSTRTCEVNQRLDHDVTHVVIGAQASTVVFCPDTASRPVDIPAGQNPFDQISQVMRILETVPHDLIVEDFNSQFSTGLASRLTDKPIIANVDSSFALHTFMRHPVEREWFVRAGLGQFRNFIVSTRSMRDLIEYHTHEASIVHIPDAVNPLAFQVVPAPPRHVLMLVPFDVRLEDLIHMMSALGDARAILAASMPRLLIVGGDHLRPMLQQMADAAGLNVLFAGNVIGQARFELMASAYATLLPSTTAVSPADAIEAMACGSAVIAHNIWPYDEGLAGSGARLVARDDKATMTNEMVHLIRQPRMLESLRRIGLEWSKGFTWEAVAERHSQFYAVALDRGKEQVV
jgi:glycosyltransferase involved in cell wall biosynthesis